MRLDQFPNTQDLWRWVADLQAGVFASGDCKVTLNAGMVLNVAQGNALAYDLTVGDLTPLFAPAGSVTIPTAHASLPRIDQVVVTPTGLIDGSTGVLGATLSVVQGTATSGATLDNRTGAAALTGKQLRLADVLVPAAAGSILAGNIRDRRPWARGAYWTYQRTAGSYSTTSGTEVNIDGTNLIPRIETSGLVRILTDLEASGSVANMTNGLRVLIDSLAPGTDTQATPVPVAGAGYHSTALWIPPLAAGSHLFAFQYRGDGTNTYTISGTGVRSASFIIEEVVRQNAANT